MRKEKIIISCGGTGGHIFPGIEIAKSLKIKAPNIDILFVGALGKMEMKKIPKEGFPIIGLWIQGIYRKSILKNIFFPIKLIISLIQAFFILIHHKPIAVIGTGGFAGGPILYIASLLRIKTYIQEQNSCAGLTNRLLSKHANKIFTAYDNVDKFFPKHKVLNLGNPIRKSLKINQTTKKESRKFFGLKEDVFTILVVGGSLGAEPINAAISRLVDYSNKIEKEIDLNSQKEYLGCPKQFIWQTGSPPHILSTSKISIHKFINRMDLAYNAADIVISRAGAIAISEICFLSKPSILIPSPHVTANHQAINAKYLATNNACIVCAEHLIYRQFPSSDISGVSSTEHDGILGLIEAISVLENKEKREQIGKNANQLFKYNSAEEIANIVLKETK